MEVIIVNDTDDRLAINEDSFKLVAKRVTEILQLPLDLQCAVVFIKDDESKNLNKNYRNIDEPTDVLSFALKDSDDNYESIDEIVNYLGDIFINVDAALRQANKYGHSYQRETVFLFTHGILHLIGYNHDSEVAEEEMFSLQREILSEMVE